MVDGMMSNHEEVKNERDRTRYAEATGSTSQQGVNKPKELRTKSEDSHT